jgi:hypothetical protein
MINSTARRWTRVGLIWPNDLNSTDFSHTQLITP